MYTWHIYRCFYKVHSSDWIKIKVVLDKLTRLPVCGCRKCSETSRVEDRLALEDKSDSQPEVAYTSLRYASCMHIYIVVYMSPHTRHHVIMCVTVVSNCTCQTI